MNQASESILEWVRSHPYEYVEQIRASQGATCSCCSSENAPNVPIRAAAALQKELEARFHAALDDYLAFMDEIDVWT